MAGFFIMQNKNILLWQGRSPIDDNPVIALMTGVKNPSRNDKTGNLLQVYIIRADIHPQDAMRIGADYSICGDCIHRGKGKNGTDRSCYVTPMGINAAYRGYLNPIKWQHWEGVDREAFKTLCQYFRGGIRWGTYGDPAIIPFDIFKDVSQYAKVNLGYTHQWRQPFAFPYKGHLQASCDSVSDHKEASALGWKTFTVVPTGETMDGHLCQGKITTTCEKCKLCDGTKADVWIPVHGDRQKVLRFEAMVAPTVVD